MALLDGDPEGGNPQTHSERISALPCHHVAIRSWAGPFSLGLGSSTGKMQEEVVLKDNVHICGMVILLSETGKTGSLRVKV